ncbi:MAG: LysR family transcriptional regulator [Rhodobacteraceae bacterium]|nr:MAG: LysR family transcriptional regulator [Paracoccaceae bacterium]
MSAPRIPPTGALLAFDAVHRLGSARAAADALGLTPSAISHKLKALESALGFPLTEPHGRGARLTPRGARYLAQARRALALLHVAAEAESPPAAGSLTVAAPPAFTAGWLAPRIGRFRAVAPDVRLAFTAPAAAEVVVAFAEPGDGAETLIEVAFFPVCAPSLLNAAPGLRRASDLAQVDLLHDGDADDWARWLAAAGAAQVDAAAGVRFADLTAAHAAAAAGQGVALGDALTAAHALGSGALVRPFAFEIPSRRAYVLRGGRSAPAGAFARWLRAELAAA